MYLRRQRFYWRRRAVRPCARRVEVRRTEGGIRTLGRRARRIYHRRPALCGLWRRSTAAQSPVRHRFSSQGTFVGNSYRRMPAARDNVHAWIFEGVKDELFGGQGFSGGGAAGFELDRLDHRLGSPLTRWCWPPRKAMSARTSWSCTRSVWASTPRSRASRFDRLIRADMTFIEKQDGGAVFSTGSITYCGSLPVNGLRQRRCRGSPSTC